MVIKLTDKEKRYSSECCNQLHSILEQCNEREIVNLERKTQIPIMASSENFTFVLNPETGFGYKAVLNLNKIVKTLRKASYGW